MKSQAAIAPQPTGAKQGPKQTAGAKKGPPKTATATAAQPTGAKKGPAAPPKKKKESGCCCNPFACLCAPFACLTKCLCKCVCNCICKIIITLLVVVGFIVLILWLLFRPQMINFHTSEASLTEFSLDDDNTLHYNLALNLSIRNPNKRLGFNYDKIEANAFYRAQRFSTVNLSTFYQETKSTNNAAAVFKGQQLLVLGDQLKNKFNDDKTAGAFNIDVRLNVRMRTKFLFVHSKTMTPKIDCDLKVPLTTNGTAVSKPYEPKTCKFLWA